MGRTGRFGDIISIRGRERIMKEYKTISRKITISAQIRFEISLNEHARSGWEFKQVITNESNDTYIMILERDKK